MMCKQSNYASNCFNFGNLRKYKIYSRLCCLYLPLKNWRWGRYWWLCVAFLSVCTWNIGNKDYFTISWTTKTTYLLSIPKRCRPKLKFWNKKHFYSMLDSVIITWHVMNCTCRTDKYIWRKHYKISFVVMSWTAKITFLTTASVRYTCKCTTTQMHTNMLWKPVRVIEVLGHLSVYWHAFTCAKGSFISLMY